MAVRKKKKNSTGLVFMILIIFCLGLVVFFYRDKFFVFLNTALSSGKEFVQKKTGFDKKNDKNKNVILEKINLLENKKDDEKKDIKTGENDTEKIVEPEKQKSENILVKKEKTDNQTDKTENVKSKLKKEKNIQTEEKHSTSEKKQSAQVKEKKAKKETEKSLNTRVSKIYFTKIDDKNSLFLVTVGRKIKYTDSPVTETVKELLQGASRSEKSNEIITNIPNRTKLLSAMLKDQVVVLNFSKEFENNQFGRESTINQLKQIVFTVTEFPNIKGVQFLIEGKVKNYLGGEGVIINKPLSRNDFS